MSDENGKWLDKVMKSGGVNRRKFLADTGKLSLAAMGSGMFANTLATAALADTNFDWKKHKGTKIKLLLNKHPYANAVIAYLENFKKLTGIDVEYDIFPEDVYFQKVTAAMSAGSSEYDVFMTGAYQLWQYGPAGYTVDLNPYLSDSNKTADTYNWRDVQSNIRYALAWSGNIGDPLGGLDSHQWAVPMAHELYSMSYNQKMFDSAGIKPPEDMPDLLDKSAKLKKDMGNGFPIATRGSRSWATIHSGYMSGLANYGGSDFVMDDGKLKSAVNSEACKKWTKMWIDMEQQFGPSDWTSYTWYEVGQALGAGKAAMIYDADIIGFFQQHGTKQAGNIAYESFAPNPDTDHPDSNIWIWALAMSSFSQNKDAAWYFLQWATGPKEQTFGATEKKQVDPVRKAVFEDEKYQNRLKSDFPSFSDTYKKTVPNAKIQFTPQPLFFNVTTQWAAALQKMYNSEISVDEGLDQLAEKIDHQIKPLNR